MSQSKVEQYKQDKANRKNWKAEQRKKKILGWSITGVCVAAIVVLIIIFSGSKSSVSTDLSPSVFDDVAIASLSGYDGITLSDVLGTEPSVTTVSE